MKPSERDELFGRLDERSANTYTLVEKQEKHLAELNSKTQQNQLDIIEVANNLELHKAVAVPIKFNRKQTGSGITLLILILTLLGKALGWI